MTFQKLVPANNPGSLAGRYAALRSAGLVVALVASEIALALPASSAPIPPPAVFAPPTGLKAPFVGVIGDSTAGQLAKPLAVVLNPRGVGVVSAAAGGCQPTDTVMTFMSREYYERHADCPAIAVTRQNKMVSGYHPKLVVMSDVMEWSDIKLNNRVVGVGTGEWKRLIIQGFDRTLRRLQGAHVVLLLPVWRAGIPRNSPNTFSVDKQRVLFRAWADRHPAEVNVVDLAPVICPGGPPCEQVMKGVSLRSDPVHYTDEGIRRALGKMLADSKELRNVRGRAAATASAK